MNGTSVPKIRIQVCNAASIRSDGDFVLYWMIASRRMTYNFGLQRAVELAVELGKPLVIFEPLQIGYRWASDRIHRFVIDGCGVKESWRAVLSVCRTDVQCKQRLVGGAG
jgi:deoxyribodipyrimidine photo-lyase